MFQTYLYLLYLPFRCGHCQRLAPIWSQLSEKYNKPEDSTVTIAKVRFLFFSSVFWLKHIIQKSCRGNIFRVIFYLSTVSLIWLARISLVKIELCKRLIFVQIFKYNFTYRPYTWLLARIFLMQLYYCFWMCEFKSFAWLPSHINHFIS